MKKISKAKIHNPALRMFKKLIGEWKTVGKHPALTDELLIGKSTFEWIEGGAFLRWYSVVNHKIFPAGIAIFGSDDVTGEIVMVYFDERKVSRIQNVTFKKNTLKWYRITKKFSQKYTWTIKKNKIVSKGKLSTNGKTWKKDLEQTFTRITKK